MLDETELQKIRLKLLARKAEIEALLQSSQDSRNTVELDQTSVGRLSRMDAMQAQQMALAAGRQRQQDLIRIDAALERIEDGSYGFCLVCDAEIVAKRLSFDPAVPTCIDCASGRQAP
ncbi:MAG: TraR/DksA family transcriptional regulator [Hyphomicrobiaceae bacterium]